MPPKKSSTRIDDLLASVTADLLEGGPQTFQDNSLRVERILLEMVRPDPVQPRRVLPEQIHLAFHSQRLTPTQALKGLVHSVQVAARQRGQPFQNVVELLPNVDDERQLVERLHEALDLPCSHLRDEDKRLGCHDRSVRTSGLHAA